MREGVGLIECSGHAKTLGIIDVAGLAERLPSVPVGLT